MKNLATSTMQSSSSRTIIPPEPMIEPAWVRVSKSMGVSSHFSGMQPPAGPPVWMAFSRFPPATPPPICSTTSRSVVPMGTSINPVWRPLPARAKTLVPPLASVPS